MHTMPIGHRKLAHDDAHDTWQFTVWAPRAASIALHLLDPPGSPRKLALQPLPHGYFTAEVHHVTPGTRYEYILGDADGGEVARPDPAAHLQADTVHGPSVVVDHDAYRWNDADFRPPAFRNWVIYELHVGCFTPQGTFAAAAERLADLADLGITAVELMPVAQSPGARNWGYDGVQPFSVHNAFGGPDGLKAFVDAAHTLGMAVILDVVYNHLGPEGNYLREFGPYFSTRYHTPWGEAVNFDGPGSDGVRNYVVENLRHWLTRYHIDGLRLDAVHEIYDQRPVHIFSELTRAADELADLIGRPKHLIAESNRNDPRLIIPRAAGGMGFAGVWADDFHHAVHVRLTGEDTGYYVDFTGPHELAEALGHGFGYRGRYSRFRGRGHGAPAPGLPAQAFTINIQTHDQVGNRMNGERLAALAPPEACRAAAGLMLLSPYMPLLFMGEEYGEDRPFLYFIDHGDPDLVQAVRSGRREEFAAFAWAGEPPDPADPETMSRSVLDWSKREQPGHAETLAFYAQCLALRRQIPLITRPDRDDLEVRQDWAAAVAATGTATGSDAARKAPGVLALTRRHAGEHLALLVNLSAQPAIADLDGLVPPGRAMRRLDAHDPRFTGSRTRPAFPATPRGRVELPPFALALYHGHETDFHASENA